MYPNGFVSLVHRHLSIVRAVGKRSCYGSVNRSLEISLAHVAHEFDRAGVEEVAKVIGNVARVLADDLGNLGRAELTLMEDDERFVPDAVVRRIRRRILRQARPPLDRIPSGH
jgi:hypothetical protein